LVNPRIESASRKSRRPRRLSVARAEPVSTCPLPGGLGRGSAAGVDGSPIRIEAERGHARVVQHEIDHLDGVLMVSRTEPLHRRAAIRALNAGEPWKPERLPDGSDAARPAG
jgi:peptide deformylase